MSSPCANDPNEVIQKVVSAKANADLFDTFVNGTDHQTVQLGKGSPTPTIRNAVRQMVAVVADARWARDHIANAPEGDISLNNATAMHATESRTLAERFADVVNAKDYGAAGDGATDDTDALNDALEAAEGKTLYIPAGTYITCTGLRIPSNTRVVGAGMDQTTIKLCDTTEYFIDCITNEQNWWNHAESIEQYGPFTQEMQEANLGNEYIVVENLTADGNCSRPQSGTGTGAHSGSAVHFANVHHLHMRNVRGVSGWLHCIDISSAMYTDHYDETGFSTQDSDICGPWYVGASSHVVIENCEGIDPKSDDCITTHYSSSIKLINAYAHRNLTTQEILALPSNKHGIEIDDGSFNIHIYGGYSDNSCEGLQIKGHGSAYPAHDVFVDGLTVKNCKNNIYITCGGTVDYSRGRNISLDNCTSYQTLANYDFPTYTDETDLDAVNGQHLYAVEYDNITIRNFRCIGDNTHVSGIAFQLSRSCRNVVVENLSFKDIPLSDGESSPGSLIYLNSTINSGVIFNGIHADNCPGGHVFRTTVTAHGVMVDGITAYRSTDDGSAIVFVSQGTARNKETIIRNIVSSGYAKTYSEGTASDFSFSQSANREYAVIGEAETLWKRAISSGTVAPSNSYAFNVGWYAETQDIKVNERILLGFKNKVRGEEEKYIGYIGSNHDTEGDVSGYYGLIFGTSNGYDLQDRWEIRCDGRLIPCSGSQNIGYASGNRPLNIYAHNVYTDSGTVGTSDETCKSNIVQIPDAVLDAWEDVEWVQFQFNDSIAAKGVDVARLHCGAVAQRIKAVFEAHGLDAHRYGLICLETWTKEESSNGTAGFQYGLRYDECLVVEAACQRRKASRLEARLAAIEAKLAEAGE